VAAAARQDAGGAEAIPALHAPAPGFGVNLQDPAVLREMRSLQSQLQALLSERDAAARAAAEEAERAAQVVGLLVAKEEELSTVSERLENAESALASALPALTAAATAPRCLDVRGCSVVEADVEAMMDATERLQREAAAAAKAEAEVRKALAEAESRLWEESKAHQGAVDTAVASAKGTVQRALDDAHKAHEEAASVQAEAKERAKSLEAELAALRAAASAAAAQPAAKEKEAEGGEGQAEADRTEGQRDPASAVSTAPCSQCGVYESQLADLRARVDTLTEQKAAVTRRAAAALRDVEAEANMLNAALATLRAQQGAVEPGALALVAGALAATARSPGGARGQAASSTSSSAGDDPESKPAAVTPRQEAKAAAADPALAAFDEMVASAAAASAYALSRTRELVPNAKPESGSAFGSQQQRQQQQNHATHSAAPPSPRLAAAAPSAAALTQTLASVASSNARTTQQGGGLGPAAASSNPGVSSEQAQGVSRRALSGAFSSAMPSANAAASGSPLRQLSMSLQNSQAASSPLTSGHFNSGGDPHHMLNGISSSSDPTNARRMSQRLGSMALSQHALAASQHQQHAAFLPQQSMQQHPQQQQYMHAGPQGTPSASSQWGNVSFPVSGSGGDVSPSLRRAASFTQGMLAPNNGYAVSSGHIDPRIFQQQHQQQQLLQQQQLHQNMLRHQQQLSLNATLGHQVAGGFPLGANSGFELPPNLQHVSHGSSGHHQGQRPMSMRGTVGSSAGMQHAPPLQNPQQQQQLLGALLAQAQSLLSAQAPPPHIQHQQSFRR
jgi:hypothetical protein